MLVGPVTGGVPAGTPFYFKNMSSYLLLAVAGGVPMPKPFMTYDQQIQKLRDKHLIVADEDSAKDILRQIGYFTLITGYKDLFKNPTTKNYRDGTTFQDILTLYRFDQDLRQLTLNHLLHVEQHFPMRSAPLLARVRLPIRQFKIISTLQERIRLPLIL